MTHGAKAVLCCQRQVTAPATAAEAGGRGGKGPVSCPQALAQCAACVVYITPRRGAVIPRLLAISRALKEGGGGGGGGGLGCGRG